MIGARLKALRENKGLTQQKMANKLGISRGTYAHYEINRREPDDATKLKIASFFGVTTDYLLNNDEKETIIEKQQKEPKDIIKLLEQEQELTMNGEILSPEDMEVIKTALEQGYQLAKRLNKRKNN